MKKILFQGDSITDAGRERDWIYSWGKSYPFLVEAELGFDKPAEYEFINRGVSGNRIVGDIQMSEEELFLEANKWELSHGGLSGRTAQQFVDYLLGKK